MKYEPQIDDTVVVRGTSLIGKVVELIRLSDHPEPMTIIRLKTGFWSEKIDGRRSFISMMVVSESNLIKADDN